MLHSKVIEGKSQALHEKFVDVRETTKMSEKHFRREFRGKMPHFTVRVPRDTAEALVSESDATGRTVSETLRLVANRHVNRQSEDHPLLERLGALQATLKEFGRDIETVTRLFLVASKLASEDDAKEWCKQNLRVGR